MRVLICSGASKICPIRWRGFSEPYGFWNTICTERRAAASAVPEAPCTCTPCNVKSPALGACAKATMRARVDLPQPDSPTTAKVLPAEMLKDTSCTACSSAGARSSPRPIRKVWPRAVACTTTLSRCAELMWGLRVHSAGSGNAPATHRRDGQGPVRCRPSGHRRSAVQTSSRLGGRKCRAPCPG